MARRERARRPQPRRTGRVAAMGALALGVALLAGACGSDDDSAGSDGATTTTAATSTTTAGPAAPELVDARSAIEWFVEVLNGAEVDAAQYDAVVSEAFRSQVPYESGFLPLLDQLRAAGPYTLAEPAGPGPEGQATITDGTGTASVVHASVSDGMIDGLLIQPAEAPELDDPPGTIEEAFDRLSGLGTTRALAAVVEGGACTPISAVAADEAAPVGSVFKLYVLAALGEEIAAGSTAWDDELVIRDRTKSLPSGILQDRPDGEAVTVREAAGLMIGISDNTATDLLIHHLGRERVERAMADLGVDPERNVPLLTTRELFVLKLGPEDQRNAYLAAGVEERRGMLEQFAATDLTDLDPAAFVQPVAVDELEWFVSPEALCRLAVHLGELAGGDGLQPIDEILSQNPGLPPSGAEPDSLWFKGGNEPGVIAAWWRAVAGGRTIVVAGSVMDPTQPVDELQALLLLAAARDLAIGGTS